MKPSNRASICLLCIVLALLIGTMVVAFRPNDDANANRPGPENRNQVRQEIQAAFNDPNAVANAPAAFEKLLEQMGVQLRAGGGNADSLFDMGRMAREIDRDGTMKRAGFNPEDPAFVRGLQGGMKTALAHWATMLAWDRSEIRAVKWLIPGKEAVIITRHFENDPDGEEIAFKMRWWLINGPNGWKFYDLEDISMGDRFSAEAGAIVQGLRRNDFAQMERIKKSAQDVMAVKEVLLRRDFAKVLEMLRLPPPPGTPPLIEGIMYLLSAIAFSELQRPQDALDALARVDKLMTDVPIVSLVRATALNQLGDYEKAEAAAAKYMEYVGIETPACLQRGYALEQLEKRVEALDSYRRGLDDEPSNHDCLAGLRRCLPADKKAEFAERFFKVRKPKQLFSQTVSEALTDSDFEAANELIAAYAQRFPDDPESTYQQAMVNVRLNKIDEAKPLFLNALSKAEKDKRRTYLYGYLGQMDSAKKALDAYASLPDADAPFAFRYFADEWLDRFRDDEDKEKDKVHKELRELIATHRKRKPDDAMLAYYGAQIHFEKKEFAEIERLLSAVPEKLIEENDRHQFNWLRIDALYEDGKALIAYEKVGTRQKTFAQLANAMSMRKDLANLEPLLKAHREVEPNDRALTYFEGDLLWHREKYADALQRFRTYRDTQKKPKKKDDEDDNEYDSYTWRVNDQIVRCLIRLKRFDSARTEFAERNKNNQWSLVPLAIEAAAGNVAKVETLLAERIKDGGPTGHLYADPDLGPILRSDKFSKLRNKYPPPKDERPLKKT